MTEIGLNLYSLRNCIATEEDFLSTAIRLREMGYTFLQYSGAAFDPDRIARVSKESGMPVILTHVPADRIINETEQLMEEHAKFGCKNIGLGALGMKIIGDKDLCFSKLESLERAAEKMEKNGFSFFYHNHHHEFYQHDGQTVFDYMIENTPHINFTLDTYWAQFGGVSVADYVKRLKGRIGCVHLKDYRIAAKADEDILEVLPQFAPVGDGTIDFKQLVPLMREAGTSYFIVEQDNAALAPDPFVPVERSVKYIKKEL